jgi:DNA-directed RNA polymerase subunit alpha
MKLQEWLSDVQFQDEIEEFIVEAVREKIERFKQQQKDAQKTFVVNNKKISKEELIKKLKIPIEELDLSYRAYNCLRKFEIRCLSQLVQYEKEDLLSIKNLGIKSLSEIEQVIEERELGLGMDLTLLLI